MSGYLPREREPLTRRNIVATALAIVAALLCVVFAVALTNLVPPLYEALHGKVSPIGPVMWFFAATFLMRANADSPAERYSPKMLRMIALLFVIMGLGLMIAVALL